jgi:osmotically-inducible protein OsmY
MLASRASGLVGALRADTLAEEKDRDRPSDPTLKDRVESELLRDPKVPKGSININAERGTLVLRGEVPSEELRERLGREAERVDGVWSVQNLLRVEGQEVGAARGR